MKAAKQWANQVGDVTEPDGAMIFTHNEIQQIQLDALKEGMRRAAIYAEYDKGNGHHGNDMMSFQNIHQTILTAAEQLTIKDV